ncbi:MAG TPA: lasso peptide biosynthesis PqqD family chaperone [Jatrophihabitantaceae bacterium]|jgi:hypothetical protein|nr:lasso peptide biosynthesis PqqD family chaperone [Jatrophihabitantaceae bacterium]
MSLRIARDIRLVEAGEDMVLLDERSGRFWQLNASGAGALRGLLDGQDECQVARALAAEYSIDQARAQTDVDRLIGQLKAAGLARR